MRNLHPSLVPAQFTTDGRSIYRILADGSSREVSFVSEGRLIATVQGERIPAVDIAWCLHYGNWPKYPLVQLDGDPFNCALANIMPARLRALRYRGKCKNGLWYHGLSLRGLADPAACRRDWALYARDHYAKDLPYVLHVEAEERAARAASEPPVELPVKAQRRLRGRSSGVERPPRPAPVEGMEWHWWEGSWVSVPVACHVADDYMVRLEKCRRGAVRFEFQPEYQEVWGFDAAGAVVR